MEVRIGDEILFRREWWSTDVSNLLRGKIIAIIMNKNGNCGWVEVKPVTGLFRKVRLVSANYIEGKVTRDTQEIDALERLLKQ